MRIRFDENESENAVSLYKIIVSNRQDEFCEIVRNNKINVYKHLLNLTELYAEAFHFYTYKVCRIRKILTLTQGTLQVKTKLTSPILVKINQDFLSHSSF